jgi:hypothetical protein
MNKDEIITAFARKHIEIGFSTNNTFTINTKCFINQIDNTNSYIPGLVINIESISDLTGDQISITENKSQIIIDIIYKEISHRFIIDAQEKEMFVGKKPYEKLSFENNLILPLIKCLLFLIYEKK